MKEGTLTAGMATHRLQALQRRQLRTHRLLLRLLLLLLLRAAAATTAAHTNKARLHMHWARQPTAAPLGEYNRRRRAAATHHTREAKTRWKQLTRCRLRLGQAAAQQRSAALLACSWWRPLGSDAPRGRGRSDGGRCLAVPCTREAGSVGGDG